MPTQIKYFCISIIKYIQNWGGTLKKWAYVKVFNINILMKKCSLQKSWKTCLQIFSKEKGLC